MKATGQLDLDEEGNIEYYGQSSGLSFMRGLRKFGDRFQLPPDPSPSLRPRNVAQDPPSPRPQSLEGGATTLVPGRDLPNREQARKLCDIAIIDASAMFRIVHLPTFYQQFDHMYDTPFESHGTKENTFLPLLYAVLALGKLFSRCDENLDKASHDALIKQGYTYFTVSRQFLDITECRDLTSLQAIVFMIQFLQSSAKLNTCYAYIGVALRSALRMGLHRSFRGEFTPIEAETRKRLFWAIRRMDTYVGAMLGLPRFLEDEDIDQEWPLEVDDEYITETGVLPMPAGSVSVMAAFNAHTRIVRLVNKICKYVYPIKGPHSDGNHAVTYTVSYSNISELERDLSHWLDELPMGLRPGGEAPPIILRVQQLLRMAFGHAQLLLYRPFLHYVSKSYQNNVDQRAFACASACVSISRNVVHISTEMRKRGLLAGSCWFSMYTTFFAIVSILYFVTENATSPNSFEILGDAVEGREVLAHFAKRSMAADRCISALKTMFERLPESIRHGGEIIESKKRRQGSSPRMLGSRPSLPKEDILTRPHVSTLPESISNAKYATQGRVLPSTSTHFANLGLEPACTPPSPPSRDFLDTITPGFTSIASSASLGEACLPSTLGIQQSVTFPPPPLGGMLIDSSGLNIPIADISTMLPTSADPLAYPTHPMAIFENINSHSVDRSTDCPAMGVDMRPYPTTLAPAIVPRIGSERSFNDSEVQLFKNMPLYLMQDDHPYRGFAQQNGSPEIQISGSNLPFDDMLNHDEWAHNLPEPVLGMSNAMSPLGTSQQYQQGPEISHWR